MTLEGVIIQIKVPEQNFLVAHLIMLSNVMLTFEPRKDS